MQNQTPTILTHTKPSRNIHGNVEYNTVEKTLKVTFKNPKTEIVNGTYLYSGIPRDLWDALVVADSLGSFVSQKVAKGGYQYQKIG